MKTQDIALAISFSLVCLLLCLSSFSYKLGSMYGMEPDELGAAKVVKFQGMYMFVDAQPLDEYKYLGTVKVGAWLNGTNYPTIRSRLIKLAKKKFPSGEALIFHLDNGSLESADIITFSNGN